MIGAMRGTFVGPLGVGAWRWGTRVRRFAPRGADLRLATQGCGPSARHPGVRTCGPAPGLIPDPPRCGSRFGGATRRPPLRGRPDGERIGLLSYLPHLGRPPSDELTNLADDWRDEGDVCGASRGGRMEMGYARSPIRTQGCGPTARHPGVRAFGSPPRGADLRPCPWANPG